MYVIVVGCGKLGFNVTRALLATNAEVLVIERDSQRSETLAEQFGSIVITSDGTEPSVLSEAGASRCDLLIATTGMDGVNLVACQVAKWAFKVLRTIAVVNDPEHVPLFKALGVDVTVSTTDVILSHIEEEMAASSLIHLMPLQGTAKGVVAVRVPEESPVVGTPISRLSMPSGVEIAAVVSKDGQLRHLDDAVSLEAEDQVIAIAASDEEERLYQTLTGGK